MIEADRRVAQKELSSPYIIDLPLKRQEALSMLDDNRGDSLYTPPAKEHYPHMYYWDTGFVAIARARFGDTNGAKSELEQIKNNIHFSDSVHADGFNPNMVFAPIGRTFDPERRTFTSKEHSDYTQPPIYAEAVMETYKALEESDPQEAINFIADHYRYVVAHYDYFRNTRINRDTGLYKIIHPHETGMDSLPQFDKYINRITDRDLGPANRMKGLANFISKMHMNIKLNNQNYNPQYTDEIFEFYDVSFNSILATNYRQVSEMAKLVNNQEDAERFNFLADELESSILDQIWSDVTQSFHSKDAQGSMIPDQSISTIYPLTNSKLSRHHLESLLNSLEDPRKFGATYMIPSVSKEERKYDPEYSTYEIWRGPVWINTNWHIVEQGLLIQAGRLLDEDPELANRCINLARKITKDSVNLVMNGGFSEFYNPETGQPQRVDSVTNFAWSALAYAFSDFLYQKDLFFDF